MNRNPTDLPHPDSRYLEAAEGWLGLGNWKEALEEINHVNQTFRVHPRLLEVRYKIFCAAKQWDMAAKVGKIARDALPDELWGHFYTAFALHEQKRTQEAYDILRSVIDKFPDEQIMRYNLACYACQLGKLDEAMEWFEQSARIPGKNDVRKLALEDNDLEPLWGQIRIMSSP